MVEKLVAKILKMRGIRCLGVCVVAFVIWMGVTPSHGQQPPEKKPVMETTSMRLASARNVFMNHARGSRIPFDVIQSTLEGWGKFTMVATQDKADIIIQISSNGNSGVQISSTSQTSPESGHEEKSSSTRKDISPTDITMIVLDARNKRVLWTGTESVKSAMKEKARENNLVDAAEHLAARFHERLDQPIIK